MLYGNTDVSRGEISLILNRDDVNDLATACNTASDVMRKPGPEHDPALADRLRLLCTLFMVAFEAVKHPVEVDGSVNGT